LTARRPRAPRLSREERIRATESWFERYASLVDDRAAFDAAIDPPHPTDLLCLPHRLDRAQVAASLRARGLDARPLPGSPHHLRVDGHEGAGTLPEVVFGMAFPQGVSSAFAPAALAPREGEVILDLCAAPGGKTLLLAGLSADRARLVGCDRSSDRAGVLVQSLARQGVTSALVAAQDGGSFPAAAHFDAILLDAPCTGEGTFRRGVPRYAPRDEQGLADAHATQVRLLRRALALLKPGGRLVYSTCSYAPEENEMVLAEVLAERGDVRLAELPASCPGLPGVASWNGRELPDELSRARRIFPHHTGSWGFFLAKLEKSPDAERIARRRPEGERRHLAASEDARRAVREELEERFGVPPEVFAGHEIVERGRDVWALAAREDDVDVSRLELVAPGLRVVHRKSRMSRPTTGGLRFVGPAITRRVVDVDWSGALELLEAGSIPRPEAAAERGLHALRVDGVVVGAGHADAGRLSLEIPRAWR
jgi:16S rRNA C967 or C1407 C5-methylase (RsmB/RsmF family)